MNRIVEQNYKSHTPEIGMGATRMGYTDRHACTIIGVSSDGKQAVVQEDKATRSDKNGMSDAQSYTYTRNPDGRVEVIKMCKDGHWHIDGKLKNAIVMIGHRNEYYDYSF